MTESTVFRPRVLLIAEAANPEWTSVPLEGWSHSLAIAEIADAHIVTQIRNRDAMVRAGWTEGREFTAIDSEAVARPVHKVASVLRGGKGGGWTTMMAAKSIVYPYFERLVWKRFGPDIRAGKFDLVHRITPLSPTIPSALAGKCRAVGVPFIWGPINGGVPWPRGFDSVRRQEKEWLSYVRGAHRAMPRYRATRRNCSAIIIGSMDTWNQMPRHYHVKSVYIAENAVDPNRFTDCADHSAEAPLRVGFIGRLVPYKGADMLIEAVKGLIKAGKVTVDILGEGPQMPELRKLIDSEGLSGGVTLHGNVEHTQVSKVLSSCSVLGFPSIREFGGAVVLEAMSLEMVPVVVGYGGPAELVSESTGFQIPIGSRQSIIEGFRDRLTRLAADPSGLAMMGQRARQRVMDLYTWPRKARQCLEVYRWVTGDRSDKPKFPFFEDNMKILATEFAPGAVAST